ncbi:response regulator [Branchiibius sp. NY16-3462-2]|uniref:response regulator n=1 Tax=Branchiibius sp. NY16-3462-2 TaxID=1807500 RepID=UPI0007954128|nr:response regulator [Branchiibius sp. NY16-3462-2]KYH44680.1 hypothetical protein AZH51_03335 [Branchiibius sp. NY16-3462-2]
MTLSVLVVEDEVIAARAHSAYVDRVDGFRCVAVAGTSREALRALQEQQIDVVLLDMNLPDRHGLDVVRSMRAAGHPADVIAISAARDLEVVRSAVSLGVVQHVLKPFVFATLRDRLIAYRQYRQSLAGGADLATQSDVDDLLAGVRAHGDVPLPKGMSAELLGRVIRTLSAGDQSWSAGELADQLGVSRVTARRYAEHLVSIRQAARGQRYSGPGRPEVEYRWSAG